MAIKIDYQQEQPPQLPQDTPAIASHTKSMCRINNPSFHKIMKAITFKVFPCNLKKRFTN